MRIGAALDDVEVLSEEEFGIALRRDVERLHPVDIDVVDEVSIGSAHAVGAKNSESR